jgi:hypothetical protein
MTMTEDVDTSGDDMDPATVTTGARVAAVTIEESKSLFRRVLGPPATEVGEFLKQYLNIKFRNALRVAEKADERLESESLGDRGDISPRTAMRIFDEAAYCGDEDEILVEYLGGVLASARLTGGPSSDVAVSYAAVISRMASDHLRLHYIFYRSFQYAYKDESINFFRNQECKSAGCFIPLTDLLAAMGGTDSFPNLGSTLYWLSREGLIGTFVGFSAQDIADADWSGPGHAGIVATPTLLGVELFLWGLGQHGNLLRFLSESPERFTIQSLEFELHRVQRAKR